MKNEPSKKRTNVAINEALYQELVKMRKETGKSIRFMTEKAIEVYIKKERKR